MLKLCLLRVNQIVCDEALFSLRACWPSGRAQDSRTRGPGFDTYLCDVVSVQDT